jgi:hypothetical protein
MGVQDLTPQLRTRLSRVERIVGVFVSLATLLLLAGFAYYVYHTGQRKGWWKFKARYHTFVESGAGLGIGGDVKLLGFNVGRITKVEALSAEDIIYGDYGNVYIEFYVLDPYQGYIWSDSYAEVMAGDFLGGRYIQIAPGGGTLATNKEAKLHASYREVNGKYQVFDDKLGDYKVYDEKSKGYTLLARESAAVTERLQVVADQVQSALPGILDMTNRLNLVFSNVVALTREAQVLLANAQPAISNATAITGMLKEPKGALGEWILPTNLNSQLVVTLASANETLTNATRLIANTDTNVTTLVTNIDQTLINLANITSNLNQQVQSNTNLVKGVSDMITNADDMVQGLKRHWLLRSAFKNKPQPGDDEKKQEDKAPPSSNPPRRAGKWRD